VYLSYLVPFLGIEYEHIVIDICDVLKSTMFCVEPYLLTDLLHSSESFLSS